jgi:hypothetical protein
LLGYWVWDSLSLSASQGSRAGGPGRRHLRLGANCCPRGQWLAAVWYRASRGIPDEASAFDYVAGFGYGSPGLHNPAWDSSDELNAVVAFYNGGAASGPGKVFFFANGQYVGSDTTDGSSSVGAVRLSPTVIEVQYLLCKPSDSRCCPNGRTDDAEFTGNGTKLVVRSQVPPASTRN